MDKMSIPYERFVHCPDHKLLYNFNKYVCKINVTITIKLIVISVVVFDKINSFAASSSSASSSSSSPPPRGKAMRVAGAVKKAGAALQGRRNRVGWVGYSPTRFGCRRHL